MTAHDQMRAMLDQLMGTGRNGENSKFHVKFDDPKVCKSFLLGCCPHEILASTRMDLGECQKIHDLALRADYEKAALTKDYGYDIDKFVYLDSGSQADPQPNHHGSALADRLRAMEHLQSFISDCDRRTEAAKKRLAETQEELTAEVAGKANKVHELAENIGQKLAKAEHMGAEGLVEESMKMMEEVEDIRKKKVQAELDYRNSMPASTYQQQKLRVCEVCSAYLGIHDNDRRLADHFGGKLHLGFIKIREKLADLLIRVKDRRKKREDLPIEEGPSREVRDKRDDRERDRRGKDHRRPDRERERTDRRQDRRRSRDRERDRDRKRHSDKDARRRSRSRSTSRSRRKSDATSSKDD